MDPQRRPRRPPDPEWNGDLEPWQPPERRRTPLWATAKLAGVLAVVLVGLVGLALLLPGLGRPGSSPRPTSGPTALESAVPSVSVAPTFVRPTPTPQPTFAAYVVKAGDSLGSIAREFHTTARSIAFWNGDTYPSLNPLSEDYAPGLIQVGWTLRVIPNVTFDEDSGELIPSASPSPS